MKIGKGLQHLDLTNKKIGEKIKVLRKNMNITQKQLGEIIGKKEITIRKYENGQITPSLDVLSKISRALNIELNELLIETGKTHIIDKTSGEHIIVDSPQIECEREDINLRFINVTSEYTTEIENKIHEYLAIVTLNNNGVEATREKEIELNEKIKNLIELEIFREKKKNNK